MPPLVIPRLISISANVTVGAKSMPENITLDKVRRVEKNKKQQELNMDQQNYSYFYKNKPIQLHIHILPLLSDKVNI